MTLLTDVELSKRDLDAFRSLIYDLAGISLSESKHVLVQSRLAKRLRHLGLDDYSQYLDLLKRCEKGAPELEAFVNVLTTNKTEFFREPHHFEFLRNEILTDIEERARKGGDRKVRIWCAASSTGEEPYTLAMALTEHFQKQQGWDLRILASDIDTDVLRKAAEGRYCSLAMEYLEETYRKKYFTDEGELSSVSPALKKLITFRQINLNRTPWQINTKFDAIFCRNVMIYFDQKTQRNLIDNLCNYLNPRGYLIIGHSESLLGFGDRLESLGNTIYRLKDGATSSIKKAPIHEPSKNSTKVDIPVQAASQSLANKPVANAAIKPILNFSGLPNQHIIVGQYYASQAPCRIQTTLGSCIAVCLFDPISKVGGMNHFMLPEPKLDQIHCASYGIHAMELLINAMMKKGADRRELRAKVFGGANVISGTSDLWNVGQRNIEFIKEFLSRENIPIDSKYVGGEQTLQLNFISNTFKVFVKLLDSSYTRKIVDEQTEAAKVIKAQLEAETNQVTFF